MNTIVSALVNGSIASAILAMAILVLTSTRMWNAASRYVIWWVALFASVTIPVVYFSADAFHEAPRPAVVQNQLPSGPVVIPTPNAGPLPIQQALPLIVDRGTTQSLPIRVSAGSVLRWAGFAWMLTSALMLVRLVGSYLLIERRKAAAVSIGSDTERRFRELFRLAGVGRRSIRIAVSDEIRGPIAIGPHRPTVLIPARLIQELDAFELDQVVLHEAAHLSRYDDYAVFIQRVLQALLVFHPVVHWISRRIDIEREIACDDFVVLATGKARPYASCLTRVAELCGCVSASPLAASASGSGSALVKRIETLLDDRRGASSRPMKARLVLGATAILAMASAGLVAPRVVAFSAADGAVVILQLPVPWRADPIAATSASVSIPAVAAPVTPAAPQTPAPSPSRTDSIAGTSAGVFIPAAAALLTPAAQKAQPPPVNVQVLVTDALGRFVVGLQKEHFRILEEGVEQSITNFTVGGPASVCIVLDSDGSNRDELLERAKRWLARNGGNPDDEFWLQAPPATPTSLFDALASARTLVGTARNSLRAIVIVSDRTHDSAEYSREQVEALVGISAAPLYSLTPTGVDPLFDTLASISGGHQFAIGSAEEFQTLTKAVVGIHNSYVLGFQPTQTARDGEFRRLGVQIFPIMGIRSLNWKNRTSYYAADQ